MQNDDVYRATIGVSSWHITRASPYDGGSRARRIEKCPWGGRSPTSSSRRCLSTPPRPQAHARFARARTMSRLVPGLVVGLGGCLKCEGGSASTKNLTSASFTVYSPWHLGSPNIAPVLALCDRGYNHVTSARYAEVGVDFRRPHARNLVCGRLRTDAIRAKGFLFDGVARRRAVDRHERDTSDAQTRVPIGTVHQQNASQRKKRARFTAHGARLCLKSRTSYEKELFS